MIIRIALDQSPEGQRISDAQIRGGDTRPQLFVPPPPPQGLDESLLWLARKTRLERELDDATL